jgi:hypothetical protein
VRFFASGLAGVFSMFLLMIWLVFQHVLAFVLAGCALGWFRQLVFALSCCWLFYSLFYVSITKKKKKKLCSL